MLHPDELAIPDNPYVRACEMPDCKNKYDDQDYFGRLQRFNRGVCDKCADKLMKPDAAR